MATLPQTLSICSSFLNYGVTKSSRPKDSNYVNGIANCLDVERKLFSGQTLPHLRTSFLRNINFEVNAKPRVTVGSLQQIFSTGTQVEEPDKASKYLFRTETGGLVNVLVRKKNSNCIVRIEVSSVQVPNSDDRLVLSWGIYRADSSKFLPLESETSNCDDKTLEIPFDGTSFGGFSVELKFEAKQIPCYLSFLLKSPVNNDSGGLEIRSHRKTKFCVPLGFSSGCVTPLGLSFSRDGAVNFSIFSRNAESVVLCLYDDTAADNPVLELELDPYVNRTGDIWHASFESSQTFSRYGYRFESSNLKSNKDNLEDSHVLLDPYAKIIEKSASSDRGTGSNYLGRVLKASVFDWGDDIHPNLSMEKLMIYRLNVKRFTEHKSSELSPDIAGTFSGLNEKLEHLKNLGVNAVLLEPISSFDENKGPYFPHHFFSPMTLYGPSGSALSAVDSMKEVVKKMHANGIEVLLEVVFSHTADDGALQGVDDSSYYLDGVTDLEGRNVLNCNFPVVQQLVLDSLRHWVTEFHIDGFCFINASSLLRGSDGKIISRPPLVEAIAFDPVLSNTKIIADFWDPNDTLPKETPFPHWKIWAEMNSRFSSDVRKFLRGEGLPSELATRLCGSGDVFSEGRGPAFSFNFIARNSGLTLVDLVSFSSNALSSELSWNCGQEGPTKKTLVLERRVKQIRNFLFILYVSLGIPVLNMGDECGQSTGGSTSYGDRKPFDWNALNTGFGVQVTQFISFFTSLRQRRSDLLQNRNFLNEENIQWFGSDQSGPRWNDPTCRFLAMRLRTVQGKSVTQKASDISRLEGDLFAAFNAADHSESLVLPPPEEGIVWHRLVDTAIAFPGFFSTDGTPVIGDVEGTFTYEMKPLSCTLFEARSK